MLQSIQWLSCDRNPHPRNYAAAIRLRQTCRHSRGHGQTQGGRRPPMIHEYAAIDPMALLRSESTPAKLRSGNSPSANVSPLQGAWADTRWKETSDDSRICCNRSNGSLAIGIHTREITQRQFAFGKRVATPGGMGRHKVEGDLR